MACIYRLYRLQTAPTATWEAPLEKYNKTLGDTRHEKLIPASGPGPDVPLIPHHGLPRTQKKTRARVNVYRRGRVGPAIQFWALFCLATAYPAPDFSLDSTPRYPLAPQGEGEDMYGCAIPILVIPPPLWNGLCVE